MFRHIFRHMFRHMFNPCYLPGYAKYLMTENTDGMLIKAGADEESVIELNGEHFILSLLLFRTYLRIK